MSLVAVAMGATVVIVGPASPAYATTITVNANLPVSSSPGYAAVTGIPITLDGCGTIHLDLGVHTNSASYTQMVVASTLVHYYTGPYTEALFDYIITPAGKTVLKANRYTYVNSSSDQLFRTPGPTTTIPMNGVRHIIYTASGSIGSLQTSNCTFTIYMNVNLT